MLTLTDSRVLASGPSNLLTRITFLFNAAGRLKVMGLVMRFNFGLVAGLWLAFNLAPANAATLTEGFTFSDSSNAVIASGSFSYDSALAGVIGYSDLTAFSINVLGQSYDLSFVNSQLSNPDAYVYFGFDLGSKSFVPQAVGGYAGPYSTILAAGDDVSGFFVSPLPGQDDPANTGADGQIAKYGPFQTAIASQVQVNAIPEPSTWAMMIAGLLGLAGIARIKRRRDSLQLDQAGS
jgi:hypothetical protein